MPFRALILVFTTLCLNHSAFAFIEAIRKPLYKHSLSEDDLDPLHRSYVFLTPNEHHPRFALPALQRTLPGVYISVGTERGFMHAAASNATHLLLLDNDRQIVLQNRMNILILKLSGGDPEKFLKLRLNSFELVDYLTDLNLVRLLSQEESWAKSLADTRWWYENTEQSRQHIFWKRKPLSGEAFDQLHYVFEPERFQKIYQMAIDGKIQAELADLRDTENSSKIAEEIQRLGLHISTIDISNAWEDRYMGPETTMRALSAFAPAALSDSLSLITSPSQYAYAGADRNQFWTYRSASFKKLFGNGFLVTTESFLFHFPNINGNCPNLLIR